MSRSHDIHSGEISRSVWLALHTTDIPGAVAVAREGRVVSRTLDPQGQHARSLLGAIAQLLQEFQADASQIEGIVTTSGPGSFTGIRIGLATAQGLASACGQKVFVCDSLLAEAAAQGTPGWIAVVLDARRGEVFAALYRRGHEGLQAVIEPFVAVPQEVCERVVRALPDHATWNITGSGASLLPLTAPAKSRCHFLATVARENLVQAMIHMAREGHCPVLSPQELKPLYLRKSDAELNRQARLRSS